MSWLLRASAGKPSISSSSVVAVLALICMPPNALATVRGEKTGLE